MLLQFSVENFLSIKDKVTFSMVASSDTSLDYNLINLKKENVLKSAIIYGPNASGKTNIIKSLSYMREMILNSDKNMPDESIDVNPFRLDKMYEGKPSRFEIVFEIDKIKYIYGFSLNKYKVCSEYLYYYPHGKVATVFERNIDNNPIYRFTTDIKRQKDLVVNTPDNTLYLSKSANLNYEKSSIVVKWFRDKMGTIRPRDFYLPNLSKYTKAVLAEAQDDITKMQVMDLISKADKGITDVRIKEIDISDDYLKDFPKDVRDMYIEDARRKVETMHLGVDKDGNKIEVAFDLSEESSGTQKIFNMAGAFIEVLSNGEILVMDEIETSLHPHLVRYLVDIFHNPKYNRYGAQLIIATHNTTLLRPNIMRRDQVWFTEKKADQSTDLRSLYEYNERKDKNMEKGYLSGRYGAIPILD